MSYRARVVVDAIDPNIVEQVYGVLQIDFGDRMIDEDSDGLVYCFANSPAHANHLRHLIIKTLERCELYDGVDQVRIEHWDKRKDAWIPDHSSGRSPKRRSRRPLTDIRWMVTVEPADVFHWKQLRKELARRGRPILDERQGSLDVPAIDEEDARRLADELEGLEEVGSATYRPLRWFERWRWREQVLGNYATGSPGTYGF